MPLYQVPTRTVSGTSSSGIQVTFNGTWQEHTTGSTQTGTADATLEADWQEHTSESESSGSSTASITLSGTWQEHTTSTPVSGTTTFNATGTWSSSPGNPGNIQSTTVDIPSSLDEEWSGSNVKTWTSNWIQVATSSDTQILYETPTIINTGSYPDEASISVQVSTDEKSFRIRCTARQTVPVEPTTITVQYRLAGTVSYTAYCTGNASLPEYEDVELSDVEVMNAPSDVITQIEYVSGVNVRVYCVSVSSQSGTLTLQIRASYTGTSSSSYWTASVNRTYSSSYDTTDVTGVTFSSGTRPDSLTYSGNRITAEWETDTEPSSSTVSCTVRVSYDWTDTVTESYWTASGNYDPTEWSLSSSATITSASYLSSSINTPESVTVSGNRVYVTWETGIEPENPYAQCDVRINYSVAVTTIDYWYASDSVYLGASNRTFYSFSRSSGTQPTSTSGSNGYVNAYWQRDTEPTSNTVTCTGYAYYRYPTTTTYAAVYFNNNLINYIYLDGNRWPD